VKTGSDMNFNQSTKTQETNQMYTTKVNVNDLVIDMPLDEANVQQKMESLKNGGLVQPVTVWLNDFRIIDGFHRTEAAKRLGWAEIECIVKDCDEETFWDARIQSAKQHHGITEERLISWISECWKATDWMIEAENSENVLMQIAEAIHSIKKASGPIAVDPEKLESIEGSVYLWLTSKAQLWQVEFNELKDMVYASLTKAVFYTRWPNMTGKFFGHTFDEIAVSADLSLGQRLGLEQMLPDVIKVSDLSHVVRFNSEYPIPDLMTATEADVKVARAAFFKKNEEWKREESRKRFEQEYERGKQERERESQRQKEWSESPEGRKHLQNELRRTLADIISTFKSNVKQHGDVLLKIDDGYEILIGLSAWSANKAAELWPDRKQPTEIELKQELASAYRRIESLERALNSKGRYVPRFPDVYAWSSTDVAKVAHGE
jgi:hypothetical protein